MAVTMRMLQHPVEEPLPIEDWRMVAVDFLRSKDGLQATLHVCKGDETKDAVVIILAKAATWGPFLGQVAARTGCEPEQVRDTLLRLLLGVEGQIREQAAEMEERAERISQATQMIELASDLELFHTPGADGDAYASIPVAQHREVWPLKVKRFRRWLEQQFHAKYDKAPGGQAVQDALGVLTGKALFEGEEHAVHTRLAEHDGRIYLDLADDQWRVVEISAQGWKVIEESPVKFCRARRVLPLPCPVEGRSIEELRALVNISDEEDWRLVKGFLVQALNPLGPYPVLALHGEQGSAKSTTARILRALIDPNKAPLRAEPREGRDLIIAATNSWLITFDNLSRVPEWLSDALCRLATGGGFSTRELYSDAEEMIFDAQRPVILTGIAELTTRGDLADRAIIVSLASIPEDQRRPEAAIRERFEGLRPALLGALLTAVSAALRHRNEVRLDRLPRMADFAVWVAAAGDTLHMTAVDFLDAYAKNRKTANALPLEASLVVPYLVRLSEGTDFEGTATELLRKLEEQATDDTMRHREWPRTGRALSVALRQLAPNLRGVGVNIEFDKREGKERKRLVYVKKIREGYPPSASSAPSASEQTQHDRVDGADGADAKNRHRSNGHMTGIICAGCRELFAPGLDGASQVLCHTCMIDSRRGSRASHRGYAGAMR